MRARIPFIRPSFPEPSALNEDFQAIVAANWYSNFGPQEQRFRKEIAEFVGVSADRVATVNNATTGLMAALATHLQRGTGAESIAIASFTFAAGAQAIIWHGYQPAWIDIDPETLQPSIASLHRLLNCGQRVSAILLTQTFGIGNSDISVWEDQASELGIPLIIDSAAGFGSHYPDGKKLGARGACEVFSFHATKPFAIGEGGAVICRNAETAAMVRSFTNFGFSGPSGAISIGLNGKLQELNAAIGVRQFQSFEGNLASRRLVFDQYVEALTGLPASFPPGSRDSSLCFATVILDQPSASSLLQTLDNAQIDARNYYNPPLHLQPSLRGFSQASELPVTHSLENRIISLPVLPDMRNEEVERVTRALIRALDTSQTSTQ